jgi:hypothetical protein
MSRLEEVASELESLIDEIGHASWCGYAQDNGRIDQGNIPYTGPCTCGHDRVVELIENLQQLIKS